MKDICASPGSAKLESMVQDKTCQVSHLENCLFDASPILQALLTEGLQQERFLDSTLVFIHKGHRVVRGISHLKEGS